MKPSELRRKAAAKRAEALKIRTDNAGNLTEEHLASIEALVGEAKEFEAHAARIEAIDGALAVADGSNDTAPIITSVKARFEDDPARGFKTPKAFIESIQRVALGGKVSDAVREQLASLSHNIGDGDGYMLPTAFAPKRFTAGSDEQGVYADPYGGFLVPESQRLAGIREIMWDGDPTTNLVTRVPMGARRVEFVARVDKNHSTSVSGGFTVSRTTETQTVAASRASYEKVTLQADKMMGIAYASSEILRESPQSFAAIIDAGMRTEFASKTLDEKLRGTGVGEYLGILNSPAVIEVAKETNQAEDTINYTNLVKMRSRIYKTGGQPVWMIISDALEQLMQLTNPAGQLIWQADATTGPSGRILGFPIVEAEECSALGDVGDIILFNPREYLEGIYQPLEGASSIHVRFLNDETAFRFTLYNAGAPWWRSALTPKHGQTKSPIITLGAR